MARNGYKCTKNVFLLFMTKDLCRSKPCDKMRCEKIKNAVSGRKLENKISWMFFDVTIQVKGKKR